MAQDQVEEVKNKTDIVSIIGEHVELKKAGRNFKGLCPFHAEKTPSFMVSPEIQIYKCFGCGEGGDVFNFLEKYEGMDFSEALKYLADKANVKLKTFDGQKGQEKEKLREINSISGRFYQYILLKHSAGKGALEYLVKDRGLKMQTIKTFNLGFSPNDPTVLSKFLVGKKKYNPKDLETAGLVYKRGSSLIDRFRSRVIFPLNDHRGNTVGFAGRVLPQFDDGKMGKYINTPETLIYHKSKMLYGMDKLKRDIKQKKNAIVVEGELDVLSSWQAGVRNVVASKGTALTEDQLRLLSRFTEKVTLALDSDFAGDEAAKKAINVAQDLGLEVRVARLGKYKDPDDIARADPVAYKKALKDSVVIWDFLVDTTFSKYGDTASDKARISREIIPILSSISDKIVQAHYVSLVAKKLNVPEEAVAEQLSSFTSKTPIKKVDEERSDKLTKKTRRRMLEERLMALALQIKPKLLKDKEIVSLIETRFLRRVLDEFEIYNKKHKTFNLSKFSKGLPKELVEGYSEIVLRDLSNVADQPEKAEREIEVVVKELRTLDIKRQLNELGDLITKYEKEGSKAKLKKAEKKFGDLSNDLSNL